MSLHRSTWLLFLTFSILTSVCLAQNDSLVVYLDESTSTYSMELFVRMEYDTETNEVVVVTDRQQDAFPLNDIRKIVVENEVIQSSPESEVGFLPEEFRILPAYPNPFNAQVQVPVWMPVQGKIRWELYDITGRRLITNVVHSEAGVHKIAIDFGHTDLNHASSGIYFLTVRYENQVKTSKLVLLK